MKHTLIRQKIIDVLEEAIGNDVMFLTGVLLSLRRRIFLPLRSI